MLNECDKEDCLSSTCCLYHLLILNEQYTNQMMENKYAIIFLKKLNHHYKKKSINIEFIKIEIFIKLLDTITKYISFFFFNSKYEYAKLLVKICLTLINSSNKKENNEVIKRKVATLTNLSAIYEKEKSYIKAEKYLRLALNYSDDDIDKAIIYNNLSKIFSVQKEFQNALKNMKHSYDQIREEIDNVYIIKIVRTKKSFASNYKLRC